jgi:hypothetical protein
MVAQRLDIYITRPAHSFIVKLLSPPGAATIKKRTEGNKHLLPDHLKFTVGFQAEPPGVLHKTIEIEQKKEEW